MTRSGCIHGECQWRICSQCIDCGNKSDAPPMVVDSYERLTPEQLMERCLDRKKGMFGPPRAIRALRRREGRDVMTGARREPPPEPDEWAEE